MTNAAAVIGLTYGGTDLQDGTMGTFLELLSGLYGSVRVRGDDVTVSGLEGQIPRARIGHDRIILLEGYVMGTGADEQAQRADLEDRLFALQTLFDPRTFADLVATLPSGATATISARTDSLLDDTPHKGIPSLAKVNIALTSLDPEWVIVPAGS